MAIRRMMSPTRAGAMATCTGGAGTTPAGSGGALGSGGGARKVRNQRAMGAASMATVISRISRLWISGRLMLAMAATNAGTTRKSVPMVTQEKALVPSVMAAGTPGCDTWRTRMLTTAVTMNTMAVMIETPTTPQARCASRLPRETREAWTTKKATQENITRPWMWTIGGASNLLCASGRK